MHTATKSATQRPQHPLAERARKVLSREIPFIHSQEFNEPQAQHDIPSEHDGSLYRQSESGRRETVELTNVGLSLQTRPLLAPDGERRLFRRMNFLRYRSNQLRARIDPEAPKARLLDQVETAARSADDVRSLIAESNLRLVIAIARKYANSPTEFEELISEGNLILLQAIDKFDYTRGYRFSTYATHAIQRHIYRWWKRRDRKRRVEQPASEERLRTLSVEEEAPPRFDRRTLAALRAGMVKCLTDRELFVVQERFGLGLRQQARSLRDLAREMGISKERVRQIHSVALDKLAAMLASSPAAPAVPG